MKDHTFVILKIDWAKNTLASRNWEAIKFKKYCLGNFLKILASNQMIENSMKDAVLIKLVDREEGIAPLIVIK